MVKTVGLKSYSDVHFTDGKIARDIVEHFKPSGIVFEPFRGDGSFSKHLPSGHEWCEITEGIDFFLYQKKVDWIITNPPFSCLTDVFSHAFSLAEHCVFLIPISKYFSSEPRLKLARAYGGLVEILHVGTGRDIGFNIGFPFGAMRFSRGYTGPIHQNYLQRK
jgi:hypothetical protein